MIDDLAKLYLERESIDTALNATEDTSSEGYKILMENRERVNRMILETERFLYERRRFDEQNRTEKMRIEADLKKSKREFIAKLVGDGVGVGVCFLFIFGEQLFPLKSKAQSLVMKFLKM